MRYFIGFLIFVGLFIWGFTLIFHHGSPSAGTQPINLPSYASTDTDVQFTINGPVVYDGTHREIQITVGQTQNTIEIIQGYQGNVINSDTYPNNESAYSVFLSALQIAGFTDSQKFSHSSSGVCAYGSQYFLTVVDDFGTNLQNLWTSTCDEGTFSGELQNVEDLFKAQIPNYNSETENVNLS